MADINYKTRHSATVKGTTITEENEEFLSTPIKTIFTYEDIVTPWREVGRLKFLLGISILANIICAIKFFYK